MVVTALIASTSLAQNPGAGAAGAGDYNAIVSEAVGEFTRGNFNEARTLFERAHEKRPTARTLRALGLCAYELKRYVQAMTELRAALADERNPLDAAQRNEVSAVIEKTSRYVGSLRLQLDPPNAFVLIDGRLIEQRELQLDAGEHELHVSAPAHNSSRRRVTVLGGRQVVASVTLVPLEGAHGGATRSSGGTAGSPAGRFAARSVAAGSQPASDDDRTTMPWILVGSGAALMIGGGILLATVAGADYQDDGAPTRSALGFTFVGGGVAVVAGGLLWRYSVSTDRANRATARVEMTASF